jgi:hypothetical protein
LGDRATSPINDDEERAVQDYFLALGHRPYGHHGDPEKGRVKRDELEQLARELGRSGDAYLKAFCMLEARAAGKKVWGEKTPRHVFRISEILGAYPQARVICLIRDARAIVASYRDWRNQGGFDFTTDPGHEAELAADHERARRSYHPLIISMLWQGAMRAAIAAEAKYGSGRIRLQRYEALATDPEASIDDLARWLGIDLEQAMAAPPMHNSSYDRFTRSAGVSTAPVERWREKLSATEIATVESLCAKTLTDLGYERVSPKGRALGVAASWCTLPLVAARAAAVNRKRIPNLPRYVASRIGLGRRAGA